MNVVFILWLRQLKLYFRSRARMIGALGQPTLFLLALGFGLGPTFARAGRGDYVPVSGTRHRHNGHPVRRCVQRHRDHLGPPVRLSEGNPGSNGGGVIFGIDWSTAGLG